ncbi:hypothetical protein ACSYAY_00555 [Leptospirillum ferriphilum]|uniref:hypothetical protein n=1 Tax=Leptospirillum ferriphilum TaxID=178606 RepID=UPI003EE563F9
MNRSGKNDVEILSANEERGTPSPSWVSLKSIEEVRREMASVYRQAKAGKMDVSDATRLVYILTQIQKAIESGDIARRVELLETIMKGRKLA